MTKYTNKDIDTIKALFGRQIRLLPITEMYSDLKSFILDMQSVNIDLDKLLNSSDQDFIHDVAQMQDSDDHWIARNSL